MSKLISLLKSSVFSKSSTVSGPTTTLLLMVLTCSLLNAALLERTEESDYTAGWIPVAVASLFGAGCLWGDREESAWMMWLIQGYGFWTAHISLPTYKESIVMTSTALLFLVELPMHPKGKHPLLSLIRHTVMWLSPLLISTLTNSGVVAALGATTLTLLYCCLLVTGYRWMCANNRYPEIVNLLPEGLMVVSTDFQIDILEQFPLISSENSPIEASLCSKIRSFISSHPASYFCNFGVIEVKGNYYECKATASRTTACVLTVSCCTSWFTQHSKDKEESEAKSSLLRFVSHELRTPANAILNLTTGVMDAANLLADQKLDLSMVVASTHFLLSVVNDLLDFTRIIADKFNLVKRSFDVRTAVENTVGLIRLQCELKGINIRLSIDDLIPELVYTDPNRLQQVLLNLLSNAVKFTFEGGISVICMLTASNSVKIIVKDSGIGIPTDQIPDLCQAFKTVEDAQRINPQGCGLGLYISNQLAYSLGSKPIEIQSKEGTGSEISFEVSIFQEVGEEYWSGIEDNTTEILDELDYQTPICSAPYTGSNQPSQSSFSPILIVDDSDFNRVVLVKLLESVNLRADEASSGLRAVTAVRSSASQGHFYRLILMDVEMPEMDGITATQEIRTMEMQGELSFRPRIVACSAHRASEDTERFLAAGMDEYLEKPVSRERLLELVQSVFE